MWRFCVLFGSMVVCSTVVLAGPGGGLGQLGSDPGGDPDSLFAWLVQIGPTDNSYPGGGNDPNNFFGIMPDETDDYRGGPWDVVNPELGEHHLDLAFRGDEWGDNPTYPEDGLAWDIREPYRMGYKVWKADAIVPNSGYTYDLVWSLDPFGTPLLRIPPNFAIRLDMDGSFSDEPPGDDPRWFDLASYEIDLRPGYGGPEYRIEDLPQTGEVQVWYIIAGRESEAIAVPEPQAAAAVVPLAAALAVLRRARRA